MAESELSANVVDIRRFSTHDGGGIRTTIFLKGCNLECSWCQNPESISGKVEPVFLPSRCIGCGLCLEVPGGAASRVGDRIYVDATRVGADWEALTRVCPTGAITWNARSYTVSELVELAQRDRAFFGTDGGVTLSGGEPLFRPHFAAALLRALKQAGINTAIETALNVRTEFVLTALEWTDHVFADCKLLDVAAHRRHTGSGNERILANLEVLLTGPRRADVTVRTPLIPGVTDGDDNISAIASFLASLYPDVTYELLNYNPLAAAKYDLLPGREFLFPRDANPPMLGRSRLDELKGIAQAAGLRYVL